MQVFALFEILKIERFHFKQTIMKKSIYFCLSTLVLTIASLSSCSSDDVNISSPTALYAIIKPEGAQLIDIIPSDYVDRSLSPLDSEEEPADSSSAPI